MYEGGDCSWQMRKVSGIVGCFVRDEQWTKSQVLVGLDLL